MIPSPGLRAAGGNENEESGTSTPQRSPSTDSPDIAGVNGAGARGVAVAITGGNEIPKKMGLLASSFTERPLDDDPTQATQSATAS